MRPVNSVVLRACVAAVLFSVATQPALTAEPPQGDEQGVIDQVVVTGTRVADRSRLDTLAPVDVLPAESLARQGSTELAQALSTSAPSLNFPRPAITDGTDHIRPATLRGLAPDQTLVLVNSKRRHQSALVNVNGSIGRGSAAVDLNAIPLAAIERVEVLRDGASAQYGSDAIAGVVNIQLKEAREGGGATASYGKYSTDVETARGDRSESDGATLTASAWTGLSLGAEGFLTLSAEYRDRDPTSRGDIDNRAIVGTPRVTSRYGDAKVEDITFYVNAGLPLNDTWDLYGWAGYQQREGESAAFFRPGPDDRNVLSIYPDGFLPLITTEVDDLTLAAGARGEISGWDADASVVYGLNTLDYGVENSLNRSFGTASPTSFDAGGIEYDQLTFNFGLVRSIEIGADIALNVAVGLEARRESYSIEAGEPASYLRGPVQTLPSGAFTAPGAQGFPGFQPSNVLDESRTAYGVYVDLESQLTDKLLASVAARAEDYSDFGSTATGKISARYDFTENFALRSTVSTGFRAPGLQQSFFTSTATNFIGVPLAPVEVGTFPATSPIARTLGARDLDAEESVNYSLGAVIRVADFEATVDAYRIEIDDRIVLSENLNSPTRADISALLAPFNVGAARFFINGVDTTTEGVDVVLRQRFSGDVGRLDLIAFGNLNDTEVTRLPSTSVLSALNPPPVLFGRINQLTFEEGTPEHKAGIAADWTQKIGFGEIGTNLKATHYGDVTEPGAAADGSADISIGSHWVVDLAVRAGVGEQLEFTVGVDNLLDEYPEPVPVALNAQAALGFSRYSPFGFNGRFYFGRVSYNW